MKDGNAEVEAGAKRQEDARNILKNTSLRTTMRENIYLKKEERD